MLRPINFPGANAASVPPVSGHLIRRAGWTEKCTGATAAPVDMALERDACVRQYPDAMQCHAMPCRSSSPNGIREKGETVGCFCPVVCCCSCCAPTQCCPLYVGHEKRWLPCRDAVGRGKPRKLLCESRLHGDHCRRLGLRPWHQQTVRHMGSALRMALPGWEANKGSYI